MTNACSRCRRSTPSYDDHDLCPYLCPLVDARLRTTQRGKPHWSSAFPHLEAWLASRPASTAASEPGSEVSSMMESGDEVISTTGPLAEDLVVQGTNGVNSNMADALGSLPNTVASTQLWGAGTQLTPSTVQSIVVQLSVQDTPSAAGPPPISIPSAAPMVPTAVPLISMSLAAPTATQPAAPTATQLAATQLAAPTATPLLPIMSVRPNQMGYFAGAPSNFYPQGNQVPYMANPSWEASRREQLLQNQLLQERQQFEAWKARRAQPQPQAAQGQAPPLVPLEPTVIVKVPDNDVEVISVRSASAKRAAPRDQALTNVSKLARSSASTSRRPLSPSRDYPRGTDSALKPSQASPRRAEDRGERPHGRPLGRIRSFTVNQQIFVCY